MNLVTTKNQLVKQLLETHDVDLLKHLQAVFDTNGTDFLDDIPSDVKESIMRGINDAETGNLQSNSKVKAELAKWLNK